MGEALLRNMSRGKVEAASAGTEPRAEVHSMARRAVKDLFGLDMVGQRPKPLEEVLGRRFDYVITVCDRAAESCPTFPGGAERIHWSFADPATVEGDEATRRRAFERTAREMANRIRLWMSMPAVASRMTNEGAHVV
jgi:protein-tyrosine-phosphatase